MKLETLIKRLQKANDKYKALHGKSPSIFSVNEDEGMLLCRNVLKDGGVSSAIKPYMRFKTGIEDTL